VTINPKWGIALSVLLAVLAFLATSQDTISELFGPNATPKVIALITLTLGIGNAINAVLHAIPSQSGPAGAAQFPLGPKT
jgi:hypothetical protein